MARVSFDPSAQRIRRQRRSSDLDCTSRCRAGGLVGGSGRESQSALRLLVAWQCSARVSSAHWRTRRHEVARAIATRHCFRTMRMYPPPHARGTSRSAATTQTPAPWRRAEGGMGGGGARSGLLLERRPRLSTAGGQRGGQGRAMGGAGRYSYSTAASNLDATCAG